MEQVTVTLNIDGLVAYIPTLSASNGWAWALADVQGVDLVTIIFSQTIF